jgi:hypothetical protein
MRIGVIIPTRGDRPEFLENCKRLMFQQTLKPYLIHIMGDEPINSECDITRRYREGYELMRNKRLDVIFFIEDDDWYSDKYIETMVNEWTNAGKPDLFGTSFTIYYNLKLKKHYTMFHSERSSMMSTLIKPDLNFTWPKDSEPYTDSFLWFSSINLETNKPLKKHIFYPKEILCLGIKHGIGKTGGKSHTTELHRYDGKTGKNDFSLEMLKLTVDNKSFDFYQNLMHRL